MQLQSTNLLTGELLYDDRKFNCEAFDRLLQAKHSGIVSWSISDETRTQHGQVSKGSSSAQAPMVEEEPEHTNEQPVLHVDPEPAQGGHPGTSEPLHVHKHVASSDPVGEQEDQMDHDISFIEVEFT